MRLIHVVICFNSFLFAAEITRSKPTWYFAGSYLRFSACYVDENNTIRLSEKFPIDTYNRECQHYSDLRPLYFKGYHISLDYTIFPKNVNNVIKCITKAYLSPNITSAPFKISFSIVKTGKKPVKTRYFEKFKINIFLLAVFKRNFPHESA